MSATFPSAEHRYGVPIALWGDGSFVAGTKLSVRSPFGLRRRCLREVASQEREKYPVHAFYSLWRGVVGRGPQARARRSPRRETSKPHTALARVQGAGSRGPSSLHIRHHEHSASVLPG